jgi:leukotriene-A4 hydrolase
LFSPIPYQKGAALLLLLEQRLGDNARFEQFIRDYVRKFAYRSIVTEEWLEVKWNEWKGTAFDDFVIFPHIVFV